MMEAEIVTGQSLGVFESGDLLIPATMLRPDARYPTGAGRIAHYDRNFRLKAVAETGRDGLISGMALDIAGNLLVLDPQARAIDRFAPDGRRIAALGVPAVNGVAPGYGSAILLPDGDLLLGEHLAGHEGYFVGSGQVLRLDAAGKAIASYTTQWNGGVGGFLGVTHIALAADGNTLFHLSETGPHIYAHDLAANRQLGVRYTKVDPPPMLFGLATIGTDIIVATGAALRRIDQASGAHRGDIALPAGRGWANVVAGRTPGQLWACDFFGGRVACIDAASGETLALHEPGYEKALTALVEIA